ncbi:MULTISPECIES: bifunctional hydroxymethylpyrimidine kinase/phosphomethylpyrimidine kinase [unclassified Sedimentibacter]|uniref:bifunctional hydroxymethylpyrimidine kinase/phosphomethylpyrimidine kinase n=1 Tax=unclassified Sedimentibacter TaxID=2649220 RepID=UPI0027DEED0B|nr:bifunctional hydroxymethylpyrimidine kinase/phosphomethylpyrimidine kinase [Sedimentibacter sp. MB35-C1]WMJ76123.1 bifunctional hydroxymethylpyrimidine kinase/phosphomethylpyrimidine kinase [Sedimentibacter sp. MB35-C1]
MKKVLTIAGSDSSGGAGIQADLKTMSSHKIYGMSVITALTAQNTTGVLGVLDSSPEFVELQMDAVFTDIIPDAVKIGMVSNKEIISAISRKLIEYNAQNIVLDPVMVSTSGSRLFMDDSIDMLINKLMPLAKVITPNIHEAEVLCGFEVESKEDMKNAALKISETYSGCILIKGGHLADCSDDLLYADGVFTWYEQSKIDNPNTHGTGCTLSSAIACNLAEGFNVEKSILNAKEYITGALKANLNLGKGSGPLNHFWNKK